MSAWKVIPEFPEYEVNVKGVVRNIQSGHILKFHYDPKVKDVVVGVRRDGKRIHILSRDIANELFAEKPVENVQVYVGPIRIYSRAELEELEAEVFDTMDEGTK